MMVTTEHIDIPVGDSAMRMLVTSPRGDARRPAILMYSDIFQITPTQERLSKRLASYGFLVATPEIYHRVEPAGTAWAFDDAGRVRGMGDASKTSVAEFDADARAALDWLTKHPRATGALGAFGFCIGGHLAFRAALEADVRATVCFYPTGVHDGKLAKDADAGTLARFGEIRGEMLLVFGGADPHVPEKGRSIIASALDAAHVRHTTRVITNAEHAFVRDEGPRWDPEAADEAWRESIAFLRRALA